MPEASILLDIATVFRFPDIEKKNKESFQAMYYQLRESDLEEKGSPDQVLFTAEANQTITAGNESYKSSSFKREDKYPIFMEERAFLSFLIALNKLIEMQPKHLAFDASKYLDEKFGHGQLL
jgi:hypothetical protein